MTEREKPAKKIINIFPSRREGRRQPSAKARSVSIDRTQATSTPLSPRQSGSPPVPNSPRRMARSRPSARDRGGRRGGGTRREKKVVRGNTPRRPPPSIGDATQADIEVEPVQATYDQIIERGCKNILAEYEIKIRTMVPDPSDITVFTANPEKNRYKDVKCLDSSRVKLVKENPLDNDYIHASFIGTRFICTQAPMANTAVDFWAMVYQQKCPCIIMLCKIIENNKKKCLDYWPTAMGETKQYGCFTIKMTNDKLRRPDEKQPTNENVISSRLELQKNGDVEPPRTVVHHQWVSWPDKGVPTEGYMAVHLLNAINQYKVPVVVHCSAGIGRTGLLAVLDQCLRWIDSPTSDAPLDVAELTVAVRRQRAHCIQTEVQYLLVHKILLDYCVSQALVSRSPAHQAFDTEYQAIVNQKGGTQ